MYVCGGGGGGGGGDSICRMQHKLSRKVTYVPCLEIMSCSGEKGTVISDSSQQMQQCQRIHFFFLTLPQHNCLTLINYFMHSESGSTRLLLATWLMSTIPSPIACCISTMSEESSRPMSLSSFTYRQTYMASSALTQTQIIL